MKFNLNLDMKSILILIFLGASILFFAMWYFKGSNTKDELKRLKGEITNIEHIRDSLKIANVNLKAEFEKIQDEIDKKSEKIRLIESELAKTKLDLNSARAKVKENERELAETKKKIDELQKNPIKREGDDLINSLKEKLK